MKNSFQNSGLIYLFVLSLVFSCNTLDNANFEFNSIEQKPILLPSCEIVGNGEACPNSNGTYGSDISGFSNPQVNWSVAQGNMTFSTSSNQSSVGVNFLSNFNGGILVMSVTDSSNPHLSCTSSLEIGKSTMCNPEPSCDWNVSILELIPTCYPSSFPYGRYKIYNYPSGANINWSVSNAQIVSNYGDEIYVSATSQYNFTVSVQVTHEQCTKSDSKSFLPQVCNF